MDGIAFGFLAAWVSARVLLSKVALRVGVGVGFVAVMLIVAFRTQAADWGLTATGLNVTLLQTGTALVLLALANDVGNAVLSKRTALLQSIGRNSYEIYLTHMFVVLGLMQLLELLKPRSATIPIWYALMLVVSILLGYVVSRWYSEPANRYIREQFGAGHIAQ